MNCENHQEITKECEYCFSCDTINFDDRKWVKETELTAMHERAEKAEEQLKVKGEYGYSQFVVDALVKERNELGVELMLERQDCDRAIKDLATNAALLAKQHDRNMELETELGKAIKIADKLYAMLNEIECTCDEAHKSGSLPSPNCPRCNWVDKWELDIAELEIDQIKQALNSKGE